jgi:hypothetical protein
MALLYRHGQGLDLMLRPETFTQGRASIYDQASANYGDRKRAGTSNQIR